MPTSTLRAAVSRTLRRLHHDERGQAMTEYVIILCSISLVAITTINLIAEQLAGLFGDTFDGLDIIASNLD